MDLLRPQDPRQAGRYRLTARLAEGGQGVVFLGESEDGRPVAVKLLKAEHAHDPQFRLRFAREVEAAQMVSGAHTAPVMGADPDGDPPWLATAYIPGLSLDEAVERDGPLSEEAVRDLGAGLAEGLASIHLCGLVHRDLKPGNVILADDGPRIIDFGIARPLTAPSLTTVGIVIGTAGFMSPEQVSGARVDTRSDVFSLGAVLAYAATGRSPFAAPSMAATAARVAGGPPDLDGVPGQLRSIIYACLTKNPAARPGLDTIAAALQSGTDFPERSDATAPFAAFPFAPETEPGAPAHPVAEAPPRPVRARSGMIAAALIVAAGAGGGAALLLASAPSPQPPAAHSVSATTAPPATVSTSAPAASPAVADPTSAPATSAPATSAPVTTAPPPSAPSRAASTSAPATRPPVPSASASPAPPTVAPMPTFTYGGPGGSGGHGGHGGGHGR